jgi:hypothetical protein
LDVTIAELTRWILAPTAHGPRVEQRAVVVGSGADPHSSAAELHGPDEHIAKGGLQGKSAQLAAIPSEGVSPAAHAAAREQRTIMMLPGGHLQNGLVGAQIDGSTCSHAVDAAISQDTRIPKAGGQRTHPGKTTLGSGITLLAWTAQ